jgi:predicted metalloprotease
MKWQGRRTSRNIEDRRRSGGTSRKGGVTGIAAVIVLIIGWYFGVDVSGFVDTSNTGITTR